MRKRHDSKEEKVLRSDFYKGSPRRRLPRIAFLLVILGIFVAFAFFSPTYFSFSNIHYVIVIDAGSTGSRIHVFSLQEDGLDGYKLLHDDFYPLEPGLSSYGKDPKKAAASLKPLLDYATDKVPAEKHKDTVVQVKATAGLRILSEKVANQILNEVENFVRLNYKFKVVPKLAEIMDGSDEGVFAWISLNYYLDNWKPEPMSTAALDLGGGSFQLVFEVQHVDKLPADARSNVMQIPVAGLTRNMYVKSYLGMGLKEARVKLMKKVQLDGVDKLTSACLPSGYSGEWEHGGNSYQVQGTSASSYEACLESMKQTFAGAISPMEELFAKDFYAFSYIYDKAKDAGLVAGVEGGTASVADFEKIAKDACSSQLVDQRFQCLDTVYINYLFSHAFQMQPDFRVHIVKKVKGEEIAWALGAAFRILDERKH